MPKRHYVRTTDMPDEIGAMIGAVLPRVSRAVCKAMDQPDFNIVSNNGAFAGCRSGLTRAGHGQVVDHVHYHIVPAPKRTGPDSTKWRSPKKTGRCA